MITLVPAWFWKAAAGLFAVGAVVFAALAILVLRPHEGGSPERLVTGQRLDLPDTGTGTRVVVYGVVPQGEARADVADGLGCSGYAADGSTLSSAHVMPFDTSAPGPRTVDGSPLRPLVFPDRHVAAIECSGAGMTAAAPVYLVSLPADLLMPRLLFGVMSVLALAMTGVAFAFAKVVEARRATPGRPGP